MVLVVLPRRSMERRMNIYTVRDNLKKTIEGKEAYLARVNEDRMSEDAHVRMMAYAILKMLEININELKVILFDVEKCCEQHALMSWEINPERMGQ
jgi:hypothetical protein